MIGEFSKPRPEAVFSLLYAHSYIRTAIVAQPNVVRAFEARPGARLATKYAADVVLSRPNANDDNSVLGGKADDRC